MASNNTSNIKTHILPDNYGFRPSTDKEIASGAPPYQYELHKKDSPACQTAKTLYNSSSSSLLETNQETSHPASAFLNALSSSKTMNMADKNIKKYCAPQNYKLP
jgi:hypothetical protein